MDGDDIGWTVDPGLDDWVKLLPPEVGKNFGYAKIFYADKGTYEVRAWTAKVVGGKAKLSDVATCIIVVEGGPKPPPPIPPPVPPPPAPVDTPLYRSLKAAYDADLDLDKSVKALKFADILEGAVPAAKAGGRVKTASDFVALTHQATDLAIGAGAIPTVRKAVGAYLQTVLPRESTTPANDAYFAKAASEFGFVAMTLRSIGGAK